MLEPIKAEHVEKAIEKFNEMGREEFLKEYGFGKAKTCWLVYEEADYDSKAIVGVAHSFIDKESVPLTPRDNPPYGGNPTLNKLYELGFECWKEKDEKKFRLSKFWELYTLLTKEKREKRESQTTLNSLKFL